MLCLKINLTARYLSLLAAIESQSPLSPEDNVETKQEIVQACDINQDKKETDATNAEARNKGISINHAMEGAVILESFENPDYVGVNLSDLEVCIFSYLADHSEI